MQCDWLTIHESEAPRPNDIIIERVYSLGHVVRKPSATEFVAM
jgi:hypothetical protein